MQNDYAEREPPASHLARPLHVCHGLEAGFSKFKFKNKLLKELAKVHAAHDTRAKRVRCLMLVLQSDCTQSISTGWYASMQPNPPEVQACHHEAHPGDSPGAGPSIWAEGQESS